MATLKDHLMRKLIPLALGLTLGMGAMGSCLADSGALLKKLNDLYPNTKIDQVTPSAVQGLYEVTMGQNIVYTNDEARFFLFGHMFDMKERRDLTAEKKESLGLKAGGKISTDTLPLSDAITYPSAKGGKRLFVFADPNCGYCKEQESELMKLKDVTVHLFMIPILSEDSREISVNVWCATSPQQAWRDWMLKGKRPKASEKCKSDVIDRNLALAQRLGIRATPTLLLEDGTIMPGGKSAATIKNLMQ